MNNNSKLTGLLWQAWSGFFGAWFYFFLLMPSPCLPELRMCWCLGAASGWLLCSTHSTAFNLDLFPSIWLTCDFSVLVGVVSMRHHWWLGGTRILGRKEPGILPFSSLESWAMPAPGVVCLQFSSLVLRWVEGDRRHQLSGTSCDSWKWRNMVKDAWQRTHGEIYMVKDTW